MEEAAAAAVGFWFSFLASLALVGAGEGTGTAFLELCSLSAATADCKTSGGGGGGISNGFEQRLAAIASAESVECFSGGGGGFSLNLRPASGEFCAELCAETGFLGSGGGCLSGGGNPGSPGTMPSGRLFKLCRLGGISGGAERSLEPRAGIAGTGRL
ncbi:hypothetical protein ACLKA7_008787 [Drosophila subpalustris]